MDIQEYKAKKYKIISLPSGLEIKTKDITPYTAMKVQSNISSDRFTPEYIEALFKEFVVDPKIPDELTMNDLWKEDYDYLYFQVLNLIIPKKVEESKKVIDKNKDFS